MSQILKVSTDGYRGPLTQNQYLPAGEYLVGGELKIAERIIPLKLAQYIVGIDKAVVVEYAPEQEVVELVEPAKEDEPVETQPLDELTADYLDTMTVPELRTLAEEREIDVPSSILKADLIALILNA